VAADDCLQWSASIRQRGDCSERFRVSTKVSHHRYLIESLLFTVQAETKLVNQLDRFRKKRNISAYEQSETVSDHEATAMINLAREVHSLVQVWLAKHHAELL
jgi:hypothetical protein